MGITPIPHKQTDTPWAAARSCASVTSLWFDHERLSTWVFLHRRGEEEEERRGAGKAEKQRDCCISCLLAVSLLLLLFSVGDDVADVLVVYVAGNIWGEGGPHVLDLRGRIRDGYSAWLLYDSYL